MKLTNGDIFLAGNSLQRLLKLETQLPVVCSLQVATLANKLNEQLKVIDDVRNGLVRKYGTVHKGDKGMSVKPEDENFEKFVSDYSELMAQEVELIFDKVKFPKEVDDKPLKIDPDILTGLVKFVEVE